MIRLVFAGVAAVLLCVLALRAAGTQWAFPAGVAAVVFAIVVAVLDGRPRRSRT